MARRWIAAPHLLPAAYNAVSWTSDAKSFHGERALDVGVGNGTKA